MFHNLLFSLKFDHQSNQQKLFKYQQLNLVIYSYINMKTSHQEHPGKQKYLTLEVDD